MNKPRNKISVDKSKVLKTVSDADHKALIAAGKKRGRVLWSKPTKKLKKTLSDFKHDVKDTYIYDQGKRCCYCSDLIKDADQSAFHLDHIIDKNSRSDLMFHLENLAACCPFCNKHKGAKSVLTDKTKKLLSADPNAISYPYQSSEYKILHPHLDEWGDCLGFDEYGRIVVKDDLGGKGRETISICQLHLINATRIADYFFDRVSGEVLRKAESLLRSFYGYAQNQNKRKKDKIKLLETLATEHNVSQAAVVLKLMKDEIVSPAAVKVTQAKEKQAIV